MFNYELQLNKQTPPTEREWMELEMWLQDMKELRRQEEKTKPRPRHEVRQSSNPSAQKPKKKKTSVWHHIYEGEHVQKYIYFYDNRFFARVRIRPGGNQTLRSRVFPTLEEAVAWRDEILAQYAKPKGRPKKIEL